MRVVPVIDLMQGAVVRGIAGRRENYRPIVSVLTPNSDPASVASAFASRGFDLAYVADLDAIGGGQPRWADYVAILDSGLQLWIDAGIQSLERARELTSYRRDGRSLAGIVAGLESLPGPAMLERMLAAVGTDRLVFSLDLKLGRPLVSDDSAWQGLSPWEIAMVAVRIGVRRMIVLDLAQVGMGQGVGTQGLCRRLRCLDPRLEIICGGGVRTEDDLQALSAAGASAVLVASALHDGRLDPQRCARGN